MTIVGMTLVDRKGRKFLFILGTSGIIVSLISVGTLFLKTEKLNVDCRGVIQSMAGPDQTLTLHFDEAEAQKLLAASGYSGDEIRSNRASLAVIYSYGDFTAATNFVRSDEPGVAPIQITRESCVPDKQDRSILQESLCQRGRRPHGSSKNRSSLHRPRARARTRLAGGHRPVRVHGVLRARPRRVRLAGPV